MLRQTSEHVPLDQLYHDVHHLEGSDVDSFSLRMQRLRYGGYDHGYALQSGVIG